MKSFLSKSVSFLTMFSLVFATNFVGLNKAIAETTDEPVCHEMTLVSGEGDGEVLVSQSHTAWTAQISGASWVWSEDPTSLDDAMNGATKTFTRDFTIPGTPTSGTLEIAADNSYTVDLNGDEVVADLEEQNYNSVDIWPIDNLLSGENSIIFDVTNFPPISPEYGSPSDNPAGLLYKLVINYCEDQDDEPINPPPADPTQGIMVCKVIVNANGGQKEVLTDWSEIPGFTFTLPWLAEPNTPGIKDLAMPAATKLNTDASFETGSSTNLNAKLFGSENYNAECDTFANIPQGGYFYGEETISGPDGLTWTVRYHDGYNGTQSISSAKPYDDKLFVDGYDGTNTNQNSDGHINLGNNLRKILIVNEYVGEIEQPPVELCQIGDSIKVYPIENQVSYSEDLPVGTYTLKAAGTYVYRPTNKLADALFSQRLPSDPNYGDPAYGYDPVHTTWKISGSSGYLGITVNGLIPNQVWGTTYTSHEYEYVLSHTGGQISFQITDNHYPDNSGFLTVSVWGDCEIDNSGDNGNEEGNDQNENEDNQGGENINPPQVGPQGSGSRSIGSFGGGAAPLGQVSGDSIEGEVLGACVAFEKYHKKGDRGGEVARIQEFLNEYMNAGLKVDGVYGNATVKAVHAFQQKYFDHVIKPWVPPLLSKTTGRWYKTTRMMANELITCPEAEIFLEDPQVLYKIKL